METNPVAGSHVCVYGCAAARRTFRALLPGPPPKGGRRVTISACPGCGEDHAVTDMGRDRLPGEAVDVLVNGAVDDGPPPAPEVKPPPVGKTPERKPDHRQRWTDEEILARLTVEPRRASRIARDLGAKQSTTVVERCAALPGVEVIRQGASRPILVRLVGE